MDTPRRRLVRTGTVCLLLFLAGCDGDGQWTLGINDLHIEEGQNGFLVSGEAELGGFMSDVEITDVRLVLTTEDDTVIERINLGRIDGNSTRRTVGFNESVTSVPRCVFVRFDSIQDPPGDVGRITAHLYTGNEFEGLFRPADEPFDSCQAVIDEYERIMTQNQ